MKIGNLKLKIDQRSRGAYLPMILLIATLFMALAASIATIAMANAKKAAYQNRQISSLQLAEVGINYYMWHLSHDNKDYCDGTTCTGSIPYGPFTHEFRDQSGRLLGYYDLYISPPTQGEAVTSIRSVGRLLNSKSERVVVAEVGMPSFAKYSFLSNSESWFGPNETTNGPVHSNVGVHFDGVANGIVSSSSKTYKPAASFGGDNAYHDGVWGDGGPKGFWVYPVPAVDFNKVSVDMTNLKALAAAGGISLGSSNAQGFYLSLRSNNSIDVYKVTRERTTGITTQFIKNYPAPANGVVFAEDNLWVDGNYSSKISIAAEIPASNRNAVIKIQNNLLYTAKDGSANVGLVAEGNIEVPNYSANMLEIDAALLSQKGHIWFPEASGYVKDKITIYGSVSSYSYWTWSWYSGSYIYSGYRNTVQTYDPYLTLAPPPEFPTTGSFAILSWREE